MIKETIRFILNDAEVETDLPAGSSALDFIRKHRGLTGTREACREGECGACAILLGTLSNGEIHYRTVASCLLPLGELTGKHAATIEGLNPPNGLNPVQQALMDEGAVQCGYCTPGMVLSLTGFLLTSPDGRREDAIDALDGNICRCTGYVSIRRAACKLADTFHSLLNQPGNTPRRNRAALLAEWGVLPHYFLSAPSRLTDLQTQLELPSKPVNEQNPRRLLVAGGTDICVQKGSDMDNRRNIDFISHCPGLECITVENNRVVLGAAVTMEDLKNAPLLRDLFPTFPEFMRRVASSLMRNRATVAGNIANASPIGDLSIILLALNATITLKKNESLRTIPLNKFFTGYKKLNRLPGEIITSVDFPIPSPGTLFHFEKVSRRQHLDIASCNSAVSINVTPNGPIESVFISAGGVAPIPLFLQQTGAFLTGKPLTPETIRDAATIMNTEITPISDIRGSAAYKRLLLRNLLYAHFITLFPDAGFAPPNL